MAYHKILAIGYIYTFESAKKVEEQSYKNNKFYKTKKDCKSSPELFAFLHSLKINFGNSYVDMSEISLFLGTYRAFNKELELEGNAYVYLRSFSAFINSIIILIILNPKEVSTEELISFQHKGSFQIEGVAMDEFLSAFFKDIQSKYRELYVSLFLNESYKPDDRELYGIIESDPGYHEANLNVVKEVVSKNASMIEGIDLFYSEHNMSVIFYDEPLNKFQAITDLSLSAFYEEISEEFKECKVSISKIDPYLPVFIDYLVEIEPLRLQHVLLSIYEIKMQLSEKTKNQMAKLKAELTDMLDFYYAIASTIYKGVKRALIIGEREMGNDDLKHIFDEKMNLLNESIEMYHELALERWNMLFTYTLAAMGFASLLDAFLLAFFKQEGPINIAILLIVSSTVFIFLAGYLFTKLMKNK